MRFIVYHHEQLPSARERYTKEVDRIAGVLDAQLAKQTPDADDNTWIVGGKLSCVDTSFVTCQNIAATHNEKAEFNQDDYPHVQKCLDILLSRPSSKKILESYNNGLWAGHCKGGRREEGFLPCTSVPVLCG
jgi:glutathione S-transferase